MSFDFDKFIESSGGKAKGFDPDAFIDANTEKKIPVEMKEPYLNPVEKKLGQFGQWVGDSKLGKGLQWAEENVTNPGRDWFLSDVMGIEGKGKRSFKELMEHPEGFISAKKLSEHFPSRFSDDPDEYKKWFTWQKGGMMDQSPGSAIGNVADMTLDPVNLVPMAKGVSVAGKGVKAAASKIDDVAKISKGLSKLDDATGATMKLAKLKTLPKKAMAKTGQALTGVPEQNILTYWDNMDDVDRLIKKYGGDMSSAADDMRDKWQKGMMTRRGQLGKQVGDALEKVDDAAADLTPLKERISALKAKIDPDINPDDLSFITEMEDVVNKVAERGAKPRDVNNLKKMFQERAKGSYLKSGQFMSTGNEAQKMSRTLGRDARKMVDELAPDVVEANRTLSFMHDLEKNMNRNLLASGRPENALVTAGAGTHSRNLNNLKKLSALSGVDMVGDARKLSAAKEFANPALLARDVTGKSATRTGLAAATGYMFGGPVGAAVTTAMTSPAALKVGLKTGKVSVKLVKKLAGGAKEITDETLKQAIKASKTEAGQFMIENALRAGRRGVSTGYPEHSNKSKDSMYAVTSLLGGSEDTRPDFVTQHLDDDEKMKRFIESN